MTVMPILEVENLRVNFRGQASTVTALRDVSFAIPPGETLALVGESGSGKSVTSLAIMGLLPSNGVITSGAIRYNGGDSPLDIPNADLPTMRKLRGARVSMIFQEPMSSLNPLFTIGDQIGEMLLLHTDLDASARRKRVIEMLELVEIPAAASRIDTYPHELSGGMRQRVMIAIAMVCNPRLLIADEPTTALDVTIQAQILDLMRRLQSELGMSILFITHDMGVVAEIADHVAVMYAGAVIEQAPVKALFTNTMHPYTCGLLASIPVPGRAKGERLVPIEGSVPALHNMPRGCAFAPRCTRATSACEKDVSLMNYGTDHLAACHNLNERVA